MVLPTDPNTPWPPAAMVPMVRDILEADAWYTGDPAKLSKVYTETGDRKPTITERLRFWTQPDVDATGRKRRRVHLPAASDIASTAADLLFGDPPSLLIPEAHDAAAATQAGDGEASPTEALATEERLVELAELNGLNSTLLEGAEIASGLGGVYLRPAWAPDVADHPLLTTVHPDFAVPEFRWGRLVAVTFWWVVHRDGMAVWRHLERHHSTGIEHALYIGTEQHLGSRRPLSDHEHTKSIDADTDGTLQVPDELKRLLVAYVPNALPNRKNRALPVGRSDTSGAEPLMDSLDATWTSWMRDIDLGRGRLVVPDQFLDRTGRGRGASFDTEAEIFSPLNVDPAHMDKAGITIAQFDIRAEDHDRTTTALFEQIARHAGYSPQSFGMEGNGSDVTATEVDARDDRSDRTTFKKQGYWRPALEHALHMLLLIDRRIFDGSAQPLRPRVEWPEPDSDTMKERAETVNQLELARAASIETKIRIVHPDWEQTEVDAEVGKIRAELGVVEDPTGGQPTDVEQGTEGDESGEGP